MNTSSDKFTGMHANTAKIENLQVSRQTFVSSNSSSSSSRGGTGDLNEALKMETIQSISGLMSV